MKKPPVLKFACLINSVNQQKPFFYDATLNLNLIDINGLRMPFVELPPVSNIELQTKTEVSREEDDDGAVLLELQTKTRVRREDDDDYRLLEMLTKTCAERERDDEE
jgi:hypothetical protein